MLFGQDAQARYNEAVRTCRHWLRLRLASLSSEHDSVREMRAHLDAFASKRESIAMSHEDQICLEMNERNLERTGQLARDNERRLSECRRLLLESSPELGEFLQFSRREFAEDLVMFWIAVEEFKTEGRDPKEFRAMAVHIFLTYIKSRRVKVITAVQRKKIKKKITTPGRKLLRHVYDEVQQVVFDVVYNGVYARYLASQEEARAQSLVTSMLGPREPISRLPKTADA
ncbi:hypothetical protein PybrP1_001509 [[Pythium] brassicae (nom. inval.)]|nr:hypothetical protein PybrP1_001509 [[Pythium] brassicae (nom. inval.)]